MQMSSSFANFARELRAPRARSCPASLPVHLPSTYLELADVVVVCGPLSSLLQCDKDETSEISRAGCHEDHWRADGKRMWINASRRPTVAPTCNQGHITGSEVSADDARHKAHFCELCALMCQSDTGLTF